MHDEGQILQLSDLYVSSVLDDQGPLELLLGGHKSKIQLAGNLYVVIYCQSR